MPRRGPEPRIRRPRQPIAGRALEVPGEEVVDGGFLELVRYGIRRPDDPVIVDSLRVLDAVLKVDTPDGPCWRRYNHDGYGQREDGGPFVGCGKGRAWPLLTGERGHYELAAGRAPAPYLQAMEGFASRPACSRSRSGTSRTGRTSSCSSDGRPVPPGR